MKFNWKILLAAAVCLLALVQIFYAASKKTPAPEPAPAAVAEPPKTPPPSPADVTGITLSGPDGQAGVVLAKRGSGWVIESLFGAPADAARIERFLDVLLQTERLAPPEEGKSAPAATGAEPGEGIAVHLALNGGEPALFAVLGLRPEGRYDSVYVRFADGADIHVLSGDLRGDMGVWRNAPDAVPESKAWLETRVLSFNPHAAESLVATYPDHRLSFAKNESGGWTAETRIPGGAWSAEGLAEWLASLAEFRITDVGSPEDLSMYGLGAPTHSIVVGFTDADPKSVEAFPDRSGDGMWIKTSDYPGLIFHLPEWRFHSYFQRISGLFPDAAPKFSQDGIRFIDIRRGGESVKLSRREGGWNAVATSYPLRAEKIDRLARLLSDWRPRDFADPGDRAARPDFGGPLLEVTLDGGDVHQYRLGGRHPVFPWRYVQVNGTTLLAMDDADAAVIFPEFSEFLDLGVVFPGIDASRIASLNFSLVGRDDPLIAASLNADGDWEVVSMFGASLLTADEVENMVKAPLAWRVAGFGKKFQPTPDMPNLVKLELGGEEARQFIILLPPEGRDLPYLDDDGRSFLLDRTEFFAWMGVLRGVNQRLDEETAAREAEAREEARKALEAAEAEALSQVLEAEEQAKKQAEKPAEDVAAESVPAAEEAAESPPEAVAESEPSQEAPETDEQAEEPAAVEDETPAAPPEPVAEERPEEKSEETAESAPETVVENEPSREAVETEAAVPDEESIAKSVSEEDIDHTDAPEPTPPADAAEPAEEETIIHPEEPIALVAEDEPESFPVTEEVAEDMEEAAPDTTEDAVSPEEAADIKYENPENETPEPLPETEAEADAAIAPAEPGEPATDDEDIPEEGDEQRRPV